MNKRTVSVQCTTNPKNSGITVRVTNYFIPTGKDDWQVILAQFARESNVSLEAEEEGFFWRRVRVTAIASSREPVTKFFDALHEKYEIKGWL